MKTMNELKGGKTSDGGKILYDSIDWYKNEEFYTSDTSSFGWVLVSKEVILNSTDKHYLEQTEEIANYLETKVFKDQEMPEEYKEAVNEFKRSQDEIKEIAGSNWKLVAEKLAQLNINQLFRHTPVEFLYDIVLMKENHGENLLLNTAVWTNRLDSVGGLVYVANTDSGGLGVYTIRSDEFGDGWCVNFSRKGVI